MGLHMVAVAKFHFIVSRHSIGPVVAWTVCPLAFKLFMALRLFTDEAVYSTRFFFFRMAQILFNGETTFARGTRVGRAFRLMFQTLNNNTSPTTQEEQLNEDTFNTLMSLTL
ncbi:hypothetical protein DEO72_LG4g2530 [Vigna unguiculata]|uniref:Uncharacterized protein n=1 Tax=Vigna unguiculata TaxID=3917 RepID=A0A4D6LUC9_VIGUN|nr:hypothetical protein DEO72_LG4g2530 [Vigna unguiculata]